MGTVASKQQIYSSFSTTPPLSPRLTTLESSIQNIPSSSPPNYDEVMQQDYRLIMSEFDNLSDQSRLIMDKDLFVQNNYDKIALCELEKHVVYLNGEISKLKQEQKKIRNNVTDEHHTEQLLNDILYRMEKSWMYNEYRSQSTRSDDTTIARDDDLTILHSIIKTSIEATKKSILNNLSHSHHHMKQSHYNSLN